MLGFYWGSTRVILGSYWGHIRVILGLYWGYFRVILAKCLGRCNSLPRSGGSASLTFHGFLYSLLDTIPSEAPNVLTLIILK